MTTGDMPSRRLAAIMFTDLVGYSALSHRNQALAIELLELHRQMVREILPQHGGIEIETVGDAFLVEFAGALAAVECAMAIQQRFAEHNKVAPGDRRMELRIGIHLGDLEHKDGKVMGDGVNIASRIHGVAEPGGICVSEDIHHLVRNRAGLGFKSLGSPELKNITTRLELFTLAARLSSADKTRERSLWPALASAVLLLVMAVAGFAWFQGRVPAMPEKPSVAVLPFANLSADRDNEYFADGVHDAVLTHLSRVRGLKVISRTSVMEYRNAARNLREIGRALDVAHVVEGNVQRSGNRVRVSAKLIRVTGEEFVWAETYDRELSDVFDIQSDLAQKIVGNVEARLTAHEQDQIRTQPTTDSAAYDLYLRGRELELRMDFSRESFEKALEYFARASAADPGFAPSHAAASRMHSQMYWFDYDRSDARMQMAARDAAEAQRLGPGLPEAHEALGYVRYYGQRDYEGALRHFREAEQLQPGSADLAHALALIARRQGDWESSIAHFRRSLELNPLDRSVRRGLAETLYMFREYREADRVHETLLTLTPGFHPAALGRPLLLVAWRGDLSGMARLAPSLHEREDPEGDSVYALYQYYLWARKPAEALKVVEAARLEWLRVLSYPLGTNTRYPQSLLEALALRYQGEAAAQVRFETARDVLQRQLREEPHDARLHANLAIAFAGLGRHAEAIAAAKQALELLPVTRDAIVGPQLVYSFATALAWSGDTEGALRELESLLSSYSGITAHLVDLDPRWDSIRSTSGFTRLIDKYRG